MRGIRSIATMLSAFLLFWGTAAGAGMIAHQEINRGHDGDHDRDRVGDHDRGEHRHFHNRAILVYPYPFYYPGDPFLYRDSRVYYTPASGSLTMADIVFMVSHGVSDDEIIDRIESSNTVFRLTAADIAYLRANRVDSAVIDAMLDTPFRVR